MLLLPWQYERIISYFQVSEILSTMILVSGQLTTKMELQSSRRVWTKEWSKAVAALNGLLRRIDQNNPTKLVEVWPARRFHMLTHKYPSVDEHLQ